MFEPREVGKRIQERRKHKGLTPEQPGQACCISVQAVSRWGNGESLPNIGTFPVLCKTLGVSVDELLGINCEPEIQALGARLARRVSHIESGVERNAALMKVLGYLVSLGDGPGTRIAMFRASFPRMDPRVSVSIAAVDWRALRQAMPLQKTSRQPR